MNIGTSGNDGRISANIGTFSQSKIFPPEMLKDAVATIFWEMWNVWEPEEGIKVVAEG